MVSFAVQKLVSLIRSHLFIFYFFIFKLFIYDCPGSLLLWVFFSSWDEQELLSSCGAWASHGDGFSHCRAWALWYVGLVVAAPGFQRVGSVVVVHGLRCFAHVGSSWTREGSCLPHWQVNSLPLSHQGSPHLYIFVYISIALGD